jgi:hypothetical protein
MTQRYVANVWEQMRYQVRITATASRFFGKYRMTVTRGFSGRVYYGSNIERLARKGDRIADRLNRSINTRQTAISNLPDTP